MYPLINAEINMEQRRNEIQNMIKYFKHLRSDSDGSYPNLKGIVSFGGNNENSNSKFALVKNEIDSYISELDDETDEEDTGGIVLEVQKYINETNTPGLHDADFLLGADSATAADDINAVNNI